MKQTKHQFIYHDSFQAFPIESSSVNLVVTSPPYPMIEMWDETYHHYEPTIKEDLEKGHGMLAFEKMHCLLDKTWAEVYRVTRDGGIVCINIGDATRNVKGKFRLYSNHSRIVRSLEGLGFESLPSIIWRKPTNSPTKFMGSGMLPGGAYVTLEHEFILLFRKSGKRAFDPGDKILRRESAVFWEERNQWFSDHWDLLGSRQKLALQSERKRSAAFPLELARRIILMYSMYGDMILDPFAGTATSSVAALLSGRNSISMDNDQKLIDSAYKSFTKHGMKSTLNEVISQRLIGHLDYVNSKDELFFRYRNKAHKYPVKTLQEKNMKLYELNSITRIDNEVVGRYKKISGKTIGELMKMVRVGKDGE